MARWTTACLRGVALTSCTVAAAFAIAEPVTGENQSTDAQAIALLKRMPVNSEQRCVGIAAVAEALLDGKKEAAGRTVSVNRLANEIYQNLHSPMQVAVPAQLEVDGTMVNTKSEAALTALSSRVAELYKADYLRLAQSERGRRKLVAAEKLVVESRVDWSHILQADPDGIVFFCGFGRRWFPDGRIRRTSHAFLLSQDGTKCIVYDPNAPGKAINCVLTESDAGLLIEWTGPYRNTGETTTQRYRIVEHERFFRAALTEIRK